LRLTSDAVSSDGRRTLVCMGFALLPLVTRYPHMYAEKALPRAPHRCLHRHLQHTMRLRWRSSALRRRTATFSRHHPAARDATSSSIVSPRASVLLKRAARRLRATRNTDTNSVAFTAFAPADRFFGPSLFCRASLACHHLPAWLCRTFGHTLICSTVHCALQDAPRGVAGQFGSVITG